jgi:hypothetical protein
VNRWVVIAATAMVVIVVSKQVERLGATPSAADPLPAVVDPSPVQVAQATLPPVAAGGESSADPEGGALGFPESPRSEEPMIAQAPLEDPPPRSLRTPLNAEEPLPTDTRRRPRAAAPDLGPRTKLDPHQLLFEPGEPPPVQESKPAPRRETLPSSGPLTNLDRRQMLFEPGEPAPRLSAHESTPAPEPRVATAPPSPVAPATSPAEPELPVVESGIDPRAKARIMERLMRVMELAGEKP